MSFDIDGARKAGYSDAEIASYLGSDKDSNFDVQGALSAGYSPTEVLAEIQKPATSVGRSKLEAIASSPAANKFSTSMPRDQYQQTFLAMNPNASQSALDSAMAGYDKDASARAAAKVAAPADRFATLSSPEKIFNERLNKRLQQHSSEANDSRPAGQPAIIPQLPGRQGPDSFTTEQHEPTFGEETAGNAMGGLLKTLMGSLAAAASLTGNEKLASDMDAGRAQIEQRMKAMGSDTLTGRVSDIIGSVAPALLAPEGIAAQLATNTGLFGIPAFRDTYRSQIAAGRDESVALKHAIAAAVLNTALPMIAPSGMNALSKAIGTADMAGIKGAGAALGQAAAEGAGFSAVSTATDKAIDLANGVQNDHPWLDGKDLAANAIAFGGLRLPHAAPMAAEGALDRVAPNYQVGRALGHDVASASTVPGSSDAIARDRLSHDTLAPEFISPQETVRQLTDVGPSPMTRQYTVPQAAPVQDIAAAKTMDEAIAAASTAVPDINPEALRASNDTAVANILRQIRPLEQAPRVEQTIPQEVQSANAHDLQPVGELGLSSGDRPAGVEDAAVRLDPAEQVTGARPADTGATDARVGEVVSGADRPADVQPALRVDDAGTPIDKDWHAFPENSGTKGIPRAEMPQIDSAHHGALINFLNARGVEHELLQLAPETLKPTQAEFSPEKVDRAGQSTSGRSVLVSSDGHVLDGHHQWLAALESGSPVKAIRLGAPIDQLLNLAHEFPSSRASEGALEAATQFFKPSDHGQDHASDGEPPIKATPRPLTERERVGTIRDVAVLNRALQKAGMDSVQPLREIPTGQHALAAEVAHVFGVPLRFISSHSGFEGVAHNGVAFISDKMKYPALAIAGHEVFHTLEQSDPAAAEKLMSLIKQYLHSDAVERRQQWEQIRSTTEVTERHALGEVVADLHGAMWVDPLFWREMAARDQDLFRLTAYRFMEVVTRAIESLRGTRLDPESMVTDVAKVREIIADAWAERNAGRKVAADDLSAPQFSRGEKSPEEREEAVVNAAHEIVAGAHEAVVHDLRPDLVQYGGSPDVHIVWGDIRKGLLHIGMKRRADVVARVLRAVAIGEKLEYVPNKKTVRISHDGITAVLSLDEHGKQKTWLLTGWEEGRPDTHGEVSTQSKATQSAPTFSRDALGAGLKSIVPEKETKSVAAKAEETGSVSPDASRDRIATGRVEGVDRQGASALPEAKGPDEGLKFSRSQEDTPEFKRWFGDSKVVDEDGRPLVMYHGTNKSQGGDAFRIFDTYASNYGLMGLGGYFTADPSVASSYTTKGRGDSPSVYATYLSIKHPLDMDAKADPSKWAKQFDGIEAYHDGGSSNESWYRAAEELVQDEGLPKWEGAEIMQDGLRNMGYDGITHIGGGRVDAEGVRHRVFIAFDPEQIKSATGNSGAFDSANPDIRFSKTDEGSERLAELLKAPRAALTDLRIMAVPMAEGSDVARVTAKNYANQERRAQWQWSKFDEVLRENFKEDQLAKMWDAADQENDLRRDGKTSKSKGLNSLAPDERAVVETLHAYGEQLMERARDAGMFTGEGVPYWTPRMAVMVGADGEYSRPRSKGDEASSSGEGRNISTSASSLKQRKYLTSKETEAAMQARLNDGDKTAQLVRNIRTMPMAMARLERAIAARELVNQIKAAGQALGKETVTTTEGPEFFTLDHPAFKTWRPRMVEEDGKMVPAVDQNGNMLFDRIPIYIANEFKGPLKAVMSVQPGAVYQGLMALKAKATGLLMYSPLIHNAVEWGRAMPAMDWKGKLSLGVLTYVQGNRAKHDPQIMREAIDAGLVPIGGRGQHMDITGIMDDPTLEVGRSWTAKALAAPVALISERGGVAVKKAVDAAGKFWHETLLWDRVGDLQMGLYTSMKSSLINKGMPEQHAAYVAAHFANRYAGALPRESMSEGARRLANLTLFSRTFTLGNLGALKDMISGLPRDVQSQIKLSGGELALQSAKSIARKKAISNFVIDIGLMYVSNSLLQDWLEREKKNGWKGWLGEYAQRGSALWDKVKTNPIDVITHPFNSIESLTSTAENEPGKEGRVRWGTDETGTEIYVRVPVGKVGEEFENYTNFPAGTMKQLKAKMSTFARPTYEMLTNDKGFGQKVYDDSEHASMIKNVGKVVWNFMRAQIPADQIVAAYDLASGHGDDMDVKKIVGPLVGLTFSKGAPGGPAVGEMYRAQREHQDKVVEIMPDVKRALKYGDEDKARDLMEEISMSPREIARVIQHQENPETRLSRSALRQFNQHATDEQKERMDRARQR